MVTGPGAFRLVTAVPPWLICTFTEDGRLPYLWATSIRVMVRRVLEFHQSVITQTEPLPKAMPPGPGAHGGQLGPPPAPSLTAMFARETPV
jgi:hypothetical protein